LKGKDFSGVAGSGWTFTTPQTPTEIQNPPPIIVTPTPEEPVKEVPPQMPVDPTVSVLAAPAVAETNQAVFTVNEPTGHEMIYYFHPKFKTWIPVPTNQEGGSLTAKVPEGAWVSVMEDVEFKPLADTKNSFANEDIMKLMTLGIVSGYEDGTYKPAETSDRYEVASMLARAMQLDTEKVNMSVLDTVPDAANIPEWARPAVAFMVSNGIMVGTDSGFGGSGEMTRAQLAAIIGRLLPDKESTDAAPFKDASNAPSWAQAGIEKAYQYGILRGYPDGEFKPDRAVTREELAVVLSKLIEIL
jgi:hypothetical protein